MLTSLLQAGFCGFVLGQNLLPLSPGEKGRSEVRRMKITCPGFMFYWKEAVGGLDSHGPQQADSEIKRRRKLLPPLLPDQADGVMPTLFKRRR